MMPVVFKFILVVLTIVNPFLIWAVPGLFFVVIVPLFLAHYLVTINKFDNGE